MNLGFQVGSELHEPQEGRAHGDLGQAVSIVTSGTQYTSFISILSLFLIAVFRDWWYITCSIAILTVTFSFYIQKDSTYYPPAQRLSDTKHFWMSHYEGRTLDRAPCTAGVNFICKSRSKTPTRVTRDDVR